MGVKRGVSRLVPRRVGRRAILATLAEPVVSALRVTIPNAERELTIHSISAMVGNKICISLCSQSSSFMIVVCDTLIRSHSHMHQHVFTHTHGGITHTHVVTHSHLHNHVFSDATHGHSHDIKVLEKISTH